jgi:putative phosphoesterase
MPGKGLLFAPTHTRHTVTCTRCRTETSGGREDPQAGRPGERRKREGGERGSPLIRFLGLTLPAVVIAVIADTHLPRGRRRLPEACVERIRNADLLLHAGDIATPDVLGEIEAIGPPVHAVYGNVDTPELREQLPEALTVDAEGARIAMVHDAGPSKGRLQRMRRRFPEADALVFGHSHIPLHEEAGGFQIFNPGSPTERRRQPRHTMGVARAAQGRVSFDLVTLD